MNKKILFILGIITATALILLFFFLKNQSIPKDTFLKPSPITQSYSISSGSKNRWFAPNTPSQYSFFVLHNQNDIVRNFQETHTKIMHVILVRKDLMYFQHLHPDFNSKTGQFTLSNIVFPAPGIYRIFANFAVADAPKDEMGEPQTQVVFEDVSVNVDLYQPLGLDEPRITKNVDDYQVNLMAHGTQGPLVSKKEAMLMFSITKKGKPIIDLENYLGSLGHSIILRQDSLDFIHTHPMETANTQTGMLDFMTTFPKPGKYKIFLQFQHQGEIITTDFILEIK